LCTVYDVHMTSTTLSTSFGPVKTGSTRPFIAVVKTETSALIGTAHLLPGIHVWARAEARRTLEAKIERAGFGFDRTTGTFRKFTRATIVDGVPTPGTLIATIEIVAVAS
jgi:hypothetical protein